MSFACKEVTFLGHTVSDQGVATDPTLTEKVENWPEPQSVRDVQQFLGLASYYRRFVKDFARIAKPLHRLTEKSYPFHWTNECASAFRELRQRLVSAPVLAFFPTFANHSSWILTPVCGNGGSAVPGSGWPGACQSL